nr:pancreatic secretory granule membrane major glycoprotein GP2 [Oryctolagus cuniculus]
MESHVGRNCNKKPAHAGCLPMAGQRRKTALFSKVYGESARCRVTCTMHPRGKMAGSDLLWLALASCTLTLACALQQGNRSPRDVHSQVQYLSCGDPGTSEADACFDPCENYQEINDTTRSTEHEGGTQRNQACDNDLIGWYRFVGGGGVQMPISCVPMFHCQADAPVWMSGDHPNVEDGIVNRTACAHWAENCCFWELVVQVKACPGGYYVYQLEGTPTCNLRYCSGQCQETCRPEEECRYQNGAWGCFCTRNLSDSDIENLKPELECGTTEITLSTNKSLLEGLCLGEDVTGYLLDRGCSSIQRKEDSDWINVTVPLQDSDCGFIVEGNETHVIYKNTLSFVNNLISSGTTLNINFQCTYSIHINASLPIALEPIESQTNSQQGTEGERSSIYWFTPQMDAIARAGPGRSQEPGASSASPIWVTGAQVLGPSSSAFAIPAGVSWKGSGAAGTQTGSPMGNRPPSSTTINVEGEGVTGTEKFSATMTLFKDGTYTDPYEEDVVELPVHSMLYVSVKLVERATPCLRLRNCYGTSTPDRDDPLKYFFIENGCVSDHEEHTVILQNGVCSEARFFLQLFTLRTPQLFLHCETELCDGPCEPDCPPRQYRSEKPDIGSTQAEHLGPSTLRGAQALPVVSGTPSTAGFLVAWPVVLLPVVLAWLF